MKENEQTNRQLANTKGVNKSLKYELLQLEQQNPNKKKNNNLCPWQNKRSCQYHIHSVASTQSRIEFVFR